MVLHIKVGSGQGGSCHVAEEAIIATQTTQ